MPPRKRKDRILAEGEATGHAHRVTVDVYDTKDGTREFMGSTTVTHEEHRPIALPDKVWLSGRVREYDHFADMERGVQD